MLRGLEPCHSRTKDGIVDLSTELLNDPFFLTFFPDRVITTQCTENFPKSDGSEVCFLFLNDRYDWTEANTACAAMGARLPVVESDLDNQLIYQLKVT